MPDTAPPVQLDPFVLLDRLLAGAILAAADTGWADGPEELVRHRLVALMDHPDGLDHVRQVQHEGRMAGLRAIAGEIRAADLSDDPPGTHARTLDGIARNLDAAIRPGASLAPDAEQLRQISAWLDDLMPIEDQPGHFVQASAR